MGYVEVVARSLGSGLGGLMRRALAVSGFPWVSLIP